MDLSHADFDFSNTSMSQATQSQVQGAETDRGLALELKESGISLQEDSSIINIHDDPRGPFNKHRKDILSRDLK